MNCIKRYCDDKIAWNYPYEPVSVECKDIYIFFHRKVQSDSRKKKEYFYADISIFHQQFKDRRGCPHLFTAHYCACYERIAGRFLERSEICMGSEL